MRLITVAFEWPKTSGVAALNVASVIKYCMAFLHLAFLLAERKIKVLSILR